MQAFSGDKPHLNSPLSNLLVPVLIIPHSNFTEMAAIAGAIVATPIIGMFCNDLNSYEVIANLEVANRTRFECFGPGLNLAIP